MPLAPALKPYLQQAMELHQAGQLDRAMSMYREVLAADPEQADALHLLGAAEWQKGNLDEAEKLIRRAIEIWDEDAGYFSDLGHVLRSKGKLAEAIAIYKEALTLNANHAAARKALIETWGQYAFELAKEYRWEAAEAAYRELLEFHPDNPAALNNLAELYQHGGAREKACALYSEAIAKWPDLPVLRANRAICALGLNRLADGWADLAASIPGWINRMDNRKDLPWLRVPLWDESDLRGKKILMWGDQGIGDEILFASMIPDLIERGAEVTVECMDRLAPIFVRSFPEANVVVRQPRVLIGADFDYQAPGLWLGRWLRPDFESFPARRSYLKADASKTAALRARYQVFGKEHIVGISWHSKSEGRAAARRMTLMELVRLLRSPPLAGGDRCGVGSTNIILECREMTPHQQKLRLSKEAKPKFLQPPPQGGRPLFEDTLFIDLQYGDRHAERENVGDALPEFTLFHDSEIDQLKDMDSFAAQICACDRVITIGNTTAHLAGSLGVPAHVLLPHESLTWYWFEDRPASPWYPSLTLVRKGKEGEWEEVIEKVD